MGYLALSNVGVESGEVYFKGGIISANEYESLSESQKKKFVLVKRDKAEIKSDTSIEAELNPKVSEDETESEEIISDNPDRQYLNKKKKK